MYTDPPERTRKSNTGRPVAALIHSLSQAETALAQVRTRQGRPADARAPRAAPSRPAPWAQVVSRHPGTPPCQLPGWGSAAPSLTSATPSAKARAGARLQRAPRHTASKPCPVAIASHALIHVLTRAAHMLRPSGVTRTSAQRAAPHTAHPAQQVGARASSTLSMFAHMGLLRLKYC